MEYINISDTKINPNSIPRKVLMELRRYRNMRIKKSFIISDTGSGKTYLAAFEARNFDYKKLLYITHRKTIQIL